MIYYCIPTHDEEKTIGVVLWKIRHVMAELPRDFQVLVGDDASTDSTAAILEPYRRVLPVVLMRNAKRKGYAATLEMLLRQAVRMSRYPKRDVIVVVQADFTDDIDGAGTMLRRIESGADIVTGGPIIDAVRPGLFERLARNYAHRVLRKFEWPEHADPLNSLSVYRVMCVKRAIDETDGRRLLAWEGAAANAALLRAALPHARRVESIEINRYTDRAQRQRRFRPLDLVGQVRRFAAGTIPAGLAAITEIDPDDVRGDLSVLQGPAANGHVARDGAAIRPQTSKRAAQPRSGERKPPRRKTARLPRPGAEPVDEAKASEPKRKPRRKTAAARSQPKQDGPQGNGQVTAEATAVTSTDAGAPEAGAAETPKTGRSRRGRRRGGRGRGNRKPSAVDSPNVSDGEDTGAPAGEAVPAAVSASAENGGGSDGDAQAIGNEGDTEKKPARRRRGRRGGRNRRRGRRPAGTNDAPVESGGTPDESSGGID